MDFKKFRRGLRDGEWLESSRATLTMRMWALAALPALLLAMSAYLEIGITNIDGKVLGQDFINYWMGAKFALSGDGALVYDFETFLNAQKDFVGEGLREPYHYSYPPNLLLMTLPLALLPFIPALVLWTVAGWVAVFAMLKPLLGTRNGLYAVAATPAIFVNSLFGQNGALTSACLGGGLLLLGRNPVIAGVLFGMLSYKPHLGVLIPVALACGGHWRAFSAAGVTVVALILGSAGLAGWESWFAFAERTEMMSSIVLAHGDGMWHRMPTAYVSARLSGIDPQTAWIFHIPVAIAALGVVVYQWRRPVLASVKAATLVLAAYLVTPYAADYDLVVMVVVFAWRLKEGAWQPWERLALILVTVMPFWLSAAVKLAGLPIGPLVIAWALWTVIRSR